MKRIYFSQQKPFGYAPLRAGLGLITEEELPQTLCQKIYTTRTRPLSGEYIVVEGSRFKAKPVEPEIRFKVNQTWELSLKHGLIYPWYTAKAGSVWGGTNILEKDGLLFPELDLGFRGATFEQLRDELLRLNKKATIETPFYVSLLETIT